jgi:hypothetical protein
MAVVVPLSAHDVVVQIVARNSVGVELLQIIVGLVVNTRSVFALGSQLHHLSHRILLHPFLPL